jgi:hypothetical protein
VHCFAVAGPVEVMVVTARAVMTTTAPGEDTHSKAPTVVPRAHSGSPCIHAEDAAVVALRVAGGGRTSASVHEL